MKPFSFSSNTKTPTTSVFAMTTTTQSTITTFSTPFSSTPSTVQSSFSFSLNGTKSPVVSTSNEFQQPTNTSFSSGPSTASIDNAFPDIVSKPSFKMGLFGTIGSTQPPTELSFGIPQQSVNPLNEKESSVGTAQTTSKSLFTPTTNSSSKDSSFLSDFQSPQNSMFGGSSPSSQASFFSTPTTQSETPKFSFFGQSTKTTNNLSGSISSQSESTNTAPSFLFKPTTTFSDLAATNKQSPFVSGKSVPLLKDLIVIIRSS